MWSNTGSAAWEQATGSRHVTPLEADSAFPVIDVDISSFGPDVDVTDPGLLREASAQRPDVGPRAAPPAVPRDAMLRFRDLMSEHGHVISISRMRFDFVYAFQQLIAADASGHPELRRLSLDIFNLYHGMQIEHADQAH